MPTLIMTVVRVRDRLNNYNITLTDGGCIKLFKNSSIHLGLQGREEAIERYNAFTCVLGKAEIPIGFLAWQPNGILRTKFAVGKYTRGGVSAITDMEEINARQNANGRSFDEAEIWENFKYFLDHALPVCEEAGVKIALHPNDPPAQCLAGVHTLIYNTECYKRAFAMANESPFLGMKLCVGCWLEGGDSFGDLMKDIEYFCKSDKILSVHFRNVSSPMPYFEETLAEDGYADMYAVMKQLVICGYDGAISVDHVFAGVKSLGGRIPSLGFATGYMKGLLAGAEAELGLIYQRKRIR